MQLVCIMFAYGFCMFSICNYAEICIMHISRTIGRIFIGKRLGGGLVLKLREPQQDCICIRASVLYTSFTPDLLQVESMYGLGDRSRGTPGIYPIATATTTLRPPLCRIILPLVSFLSVLSRYSTGGFGGHWYESEPMMGSMSRVSDSHIALRIQLIKNQKPHHPVKTSGKDLRGR